jgi:hypothetical protein
MTEGEKRRRILEAIVVIPWVMGEISLPFADTTELTQRVEELNLLVDKIEEEDPWVKEKFGVTGSGEGLVV